MLTMETKPLPAESPKSQHVIDLTRETDVAYWCRIFDVSIDQLRDAVHHAGHQVEEIRRYLDRVPPRRS
jgi:hypothetical protein